MPNGFNKEERVAFEEQLEGFDDNLVMSNLVARYNTPPVLMERANHTIWRPMPYIAQSFEGEDQTGNFKDSTQLSVPASISRRRSVPFSMTDVELNDALQEKRLGRAAMQKLASDINLSIMATAANEGTLVVKRTTAASGFDDVAECEAIMNEQGIGGYDRYLALSTRDYNGMAGNLAERQTLTPKALTAYEKAYIGRVSSFETYKLDYANRLTATTGAGVALSGGAPYVPVSTSTAVNVDNRYQTVNITGTDPKAGDCFTLAGIFAAHHITKESTGQLKTFRVISVPSAGTMVISPAIITAQGGEDAALQYQNCVGTLAANNAVNFDLNTADASVNPFWHKDALEILPGEFTIPRDSGVAVITGKTANGIGLQWSKAYNQKTAKIDFRMDVRWGVVNKQPEMTGIIIFDQV